MKKLLALLFILLAPSFAYAQRGVISGGSGSAPGGSSGQIQYNNNGTLGGFTASQAFNAITGGNIIDPRDSQFGSNTCTGYYIISTSTLGSGGSGYSVGDTFTINQQMGGTSQSTIIAEQAVGKVTAVSGGVVTAYTLTSPGGGYSVASGVGTTATSGSGTGLTINITAIGTGNDDTAAFEAAIAKAAPIGAAVLVPNGCWIDNLKIQNGTNLVGQGWAVNYDYDYNPMPRFFIIGTPAFAINFNGAASASFVGFEVFGGYNGSVYGTTACFGSTTGNSGYPQGKMWFINVSAKQCMYGLEPTGGYVLAVSENSDWGANGTGVGGSLSDFLSQGDTFASDNIGMNFNGGNGGFTRIINDRFEYNNIGIYGSLYQLVMSGTQFDHHTGCAIEATNFGVVDISTSAFRGSGQNGSFTVTGAANNGSGLIRLTVQGNNNTSNIATGNQMTVAGVGGVTAANGNWTITVVDSTHIDLQGSTFSGSYTSGGYAGVWGADADICINPTTGSYGLHLYNNQFTNASAVGGYSSPAFILDDQSANSDYIEIVGGFNDPTYGGAPSYTIAPANWETYGAPAHARIDTMGSPKLNNDSTAAALPSMASDPPNPLPGYIYFNTTLNAVRIYEAGAWKSL